MHIPPEVVNQLLLTLASILGAAAVALTAPFIRKASSYLEVKLGAENYRYAKDLAATIVRALEQSPAWKSFDSVAKKEAAIQQLVHYFAQYGIELSPDTIDQLIEEAVQEMNAELDPLKGQPLPMG
jgi:hypothetical protein